MACNCAQQAKLNGTSFQLSPLTRDIAAASVAISVPAVYAWVAPLDWPRGDLVVNIGAAVGLYFATYWVLQKFVG
jgi:hypothetical protein